MEGGREGGMCGEEKQASTHESNYIRSNKKNHNKKKYEKIAIRMRSTRRITRRRRMITSP